MHASLRTVTPANGKMKEEIPEREKCGSVEDCRNAKQSGRKQRVKIQITVIACTVSIPLFFLNSQDSISFTAFFLLSPFNSLEDANPSGPLAPLHGMMSF